MQCWFRSDIMYIFELLETSCDLFDHAAFKHAGRSVLLKIDNKRIHNERNALWSNRNFSVSVILYPFVYTIKSCFVKIWPLLVSHSILISLLTVTLRGLTSHIYFFIPQFQYMKFMNQFNDQLPVVLPSQLVRVVHRYLKGQGSIPGKPGRFWLRWSSLHLYVTTTTTNTLSQKPREPRKSQQWE